MICLSLWVRRQWIYQERLSYLVIHLPAEMTISGGTLFYSKLLWLGGAIYTKTVERYRLDTNLFSTFRCRFSILDATRPFLLSLVLLLAVERNSHHR